MVMSLAWWYGIAWEHYLWSPYCHLSLCKVLSLCVIPMLSPAMLGIITASIQDSTFIYYCCYPLFQLYFINCGYWCRRTCLVCIERSVVCRLYFYELRRWNGCRNVVNSASVLKHCSVLWAFSYWRLVEL